MVAGRPGIKDSRHADNLPPWFLALVDVVVWLSAFISAAELAPYALAWLTPGGRVDRWLISLGMPAATRGVPPPLDELLPLFIVSAPSALMAIHLMRGYAPLLAQTRTRVLAVCVAGALAGVAASTLVLFLVANATTSRLLLSLLFAFGAAGLLAVRLGLRTYKVRRYVAGHYTRHVVIVGAGPRVPQLVEHIRRHVPGYAYHVTGVLTPDGDAPIAGVPRLGPPEALGDLLIHQPIHDVVAVQPLEQARWLAGVLEQCDYLRVTLHIVPEALVDAPLRDLAVPRSADALALPSITLYAVEPDNTQLFLKRLFDVVVAAVALAVLSPLFLVIAALIKVTTPDMPVFYRWNVVGYKGRRFTGFKFTTMRADPDAGRAVAGLEGLNEMEGPVFKIKADPRMTPLGRWLRKFSLNELPQLWSVVKGDMSLVGPRPAFPHELGQYEYWQKRKLAVRPGITCLWQVSGRNAIADFDEWVRLDLEYIENWSLWLDVKILLRTIGAVVKGTGS